MSGETLINQTVMNSMEKLTETEFHLVALMYILIYIHNVQKVPTPFLLETFTNVITDSPNKSVHLKSGWIEKLFIKSKQNIETTVRFNIPF